MSKHRGGIGILLRSAVVMGLVAAGGFAGGATLVLDPPTASAAPSPALTKSEIKAIRDSVKAALANVGPSFTVGAALSQVMASDIATYGAAAISVVTAAAIFDGVPSWQVVADVLPAAVGAGIDVETVTADIALGAISAGVPAKIVTEALMADAIQDGYAASAIGAGLGDAAAQLVRTDSYAAYAIAAAVANLGTVAIEQAFAGAVVNRGGPRRLADAGAQPPYLFGITGQFLGNGNHPQGQGGTFFVPSCTNPSCT